MPGCSAREGSGLALVIGTGQAGLGGGRRALAMTSPKTSEITVILERPFFFLWAPVIYSPELDQTVN